MKRALITGITGQDGSYLAELLIEKGYEVHGIIRRSSTINTGRLSTLYRQHNEKRLKLYYGDLSDSSGIRHIVNRAKPDEVYNLAAQSHVRVSFDQPEYTADIVATGTIRLFDVIRDYITDTGKDVRIYQAGSSEMYGAAGAPQSETTPFYPRSPYAVSKVAAHWYGVNYRESYNMFICNGILFNHESPRRGETFVTRKITRAVGRIKLGLQQELKLGNLDARRDWGFAGDYVEAMWLMLQQEKPGDYVIATGKSYSVKDFLEAAFSCVGLNWQDYVTFDSRYLRPAEVDYLQGDASLARKALNWSPKVGFPELVQMMVDHDIELAKQEKTLLDSGFSEFQLF